MRLRITLALVAILVLALVLAGGASLFLVRRATTDDARRTVLHQTVQLVKATNKLESGATHTSVTTLLPLIKSIAGVTAAVAFVGDHGLIIGRPPPGLPATLLDGTLGRSLTEGHPVSGTRGPLAWAAAPLIAASVAGGTTVALVLEKTIVDSTASVWYFLLAGGISLLVAAALAAVVTSRISRRVVASAHTAEAIAGGDLGARVELSARDYPELRALSRAINTMAAGLEQVRELERHFLLSISHDLRTPLTSIRGYAEAIADGATSDPARAANVIVRESDRLQRLIGDLLQLARLESQHFDLTIAPVDLAEVVAHGAGALTYAFESAEIELVIAVGGAPVLAMTDADRFTQIVANLVENALKFARSRVTIGLEVLATSAQLVVEDDGPGITAEDRPHVFDRLYTAGRDATRQAGTGLGLAIVAELTAIMGASVRIDSPLDERGGTRFIVEVPTTITERAGD